MNRYKELRTSGVNPAWMAALQEALGLPGTGVADIATSDALVKLLDDAGQHPRHLLDEKSRLWLKGYFPKLMTVPDTLGPQDAKDVSREREVRGAGADAPENVAVRKSGQGSSYSDYAKNTLKSGKFLGQPVIAHPEFLARLENANAYLRSKAAPGTNDEAIGAQLGITKLSHFRPSGAKSDQMYHGLGFALDVNPKANNWSFTKSQSSKLGSVMKNAGDLFGEKTIRSAADMSRNASKMSTEDLFAKLAESNEALKRYRAMAQDTALLEQHLASEACPAAAKKRGAAWWKSTLKKDEKFLLGRMTDADGKESKGAGFMDYEKETVTALRDAAGLRWGGADLGGDSGDLMHFDGGTMGTAIALRNATRKARAEAAAKKADDKAPAGGAPPS
ncbi:MAG: hypothetical protein KC635_21080 [Myxococcales bacterium]|nr:hypothetical protein [Myxococcales bacterium]MCB9734861.1 hypothetical protein [Deltaproteobacteria bacterium]